MKTEEMAETNVIIFKTETTEGYMAIHFVSIEKINNIECVRVISRMFVDSNDANEKIIRKYFGKYYIQREMLYQLSTLYYINEVVRILKSQ